MAASQNNDVRAIVNEALRLCVVTDDLLRIVKERANGLQDPSDESLGAYAPNIVMEKIISANNLFSLIDNIVTKLDKLNNKSDGHEKKSYCRFSWVQTFTTIDVEIQIDENLTLSQLLVEVTATKILVQSRITDKIFLEGTLLQKCDAAETTWTMNGAKLKLCIKKAIGCWWICLLESKLKFDLNNSRKKASKH
ncbi:uncharacterized protein CBL_14576 [Carabus blaptoides fortunei]